MSEPAENQKPENQKQRKKLFIKTYGCQMNVYDSQRMADLLSSRGYQLTDQAADADLLILNTCHIREKAAEKTYSELGRIKHLKDPKSGGGNQVKIAVAGCVAQAEGEEILRRAPMVDLVVGPQSYHRLPEMLDQTLASNKPVLDTDFPAESKFASLPAPARDKIAARGATAFLTIQEGCDKFCSFCVVPYTRGIEISRPVTDIAAEARRLVAAGVREITLLGQNVNAYHGVDANGKTCSLGDLLNHLSEIENLARLRYTTSHPHDMADDLIHAHRDNPKVMPYLHLPVQSGADKILAAMNRKHTSDDYRRIIGRLRNARPDIALSSDFIVGFPGESEDDFTATMKLVEEIGFAQSFSFKYSPRPGTPAAAIEDQVADEIKSERLSALQVLLKTQQDSFNAGTVGRTVDVLLDRVGRKPGQLVGRTPYLQAIHIDAPAHHIGQILPVRVTATLANSLQGIAPGNG